MPPPRAPTKWDPDPDEPSIRRWRENLRRGSVATGDAWFRALRRFCAESEHAALELTRMKPKALRDLFMDFAARDERRGVGGSYTAYTLKVARNWLRFNGVSPPEGVKVRSADSVFEETALSQEQLRAALSAATPRERVAILLLAQAGVRPEVVGNYDGTDGLRVRDLPELAIRGGRAEFTSVPAVLAIRRELSKASHRYVTYAGEEACGVLTDYLNARLAGGEKVGPDSAIFPPERTDLTSRTFVRTTKIGDSIRRAFRAAGLKDRPYVLRTTAASRFAEAENRGLVSHSFWQHWLGHSGDMSARYSVNRGKLPSSLVDEMRAAYRRCEPFLSTIPLKSNDDAANRVIRALLLSRGMTEQEADKLDLSAKSEGELVELFKKLGAASQPARPVQRAFPNAEVPGRLEAGWEFVSRLDDGRSVLRGPAGLPGAYLPTPGLGS